MIRTRKLVISVLCMLLLPVLASACASAPAPAPTAIPPSPTALQVLISASATTAPATREPASPTTNAAAGEVTGASLYQISCAVCHGADRKGSSFDMDGQKIDVPSLAWDELSATYAANPSRGSVADQVALSITKGQDETGGDLNAMMPHWSAFSKAQVDSLVQYLQAADTSTGAASALSPEASNLMGEQLYQASCSACHGADGAGKTFELDGNKISTPSLHWGELTDTYSADASRGTVAQQVALGITKGQDETGGDLNAMMPRWSSLSQAQIDSLVKYLQTAFP